MGKGTIIGVGAKKKNSETFTREQLNKEVAKATKEVNDELNSKIAELETVKFELEAKNKELTEAQNQIAELEKNTK